MEDNTVSKIVNARVQRWAMIESHAQTTAAEEEFVARIDRIRARVALKLADGIQQTDAALPRMNGNGSDAIAAVASAYRWFHDISGIGPTIGFEATGRQARLCTNIMVSAFRAGRGLSPDELELLTSGLETFRIAALNETHSTGLNQRSAP
jgi:hypothetical protein